MMAFCACMRFSASWNTSEYSASMTSSVHSRPRSAGKQCMNLHCGPAFSMSAPLIWNPSNAAYRDSPSSFCPAFMDAHTSP